MDRRSPKNKRRSGMGNPHEEGYFYDGYRDAGQSEKWEEDVVYDPICNSQFKGSEQCRKIEEFLCVADQQLKTDGSVYMVKKPSFIEPPFFSKPRIKLATVNVPILSAIRDILVWEVPAGQRLILTSIGLSTDRPDLLASNFIGLKTWFEANTELGNLDPTNVIPIFEDTSDIFFYISPGLIPFPPEFGQIGAAFPGNPQEPYNFLENGLLFLVKGPTQLKFRAQNNYEFVGEDINVTAFITFYQYWMEPSSEFEKSDIQI